MNLSKLSDYHRGWFILGSEFSPKVFESNVELGCRNYKAGDEEQCHYHSKAIEVNLVTFGVALFIVNGKDVIVKDGEIILIEKNEAVEFHAVSDCQIICFKSVSVENDKYLI